MATARRSSTTPTSDAITSENASTSAHLLDKRHRHELTGNGEGSASSITDLVIDQIDVGLELDDPDDRISDESPIPAGHG